MDARNALELLGWNYAELSRRLQVRPNTVTEWFKPNGEPPGYALAYLALALELKAARDVAGKALEKTR